MFINIEKPSKTVRTYTDGDKSYLVCGGFDHKTGKCDNENDIFNDIVEFAKNNFKIGTLEYKWIYTRLYNNRQHTLYRPYK